MASSCRLSAPSLRLPSFSLLLFHLLSSLLLCCQYSLFFNLSDFFLEFTHFRHPWIVA